MTAHARLVAYYKARLRFDAAQLLNPSDPNFHAKFFEAAADLHIAVNNIRPEDLEEAPPSPRINRFVFQPLDSSAASFLEEQTQLFLTTTIQHIFDFYQHQNVPTINQVELSTPVLLSIVKTICLQGGYSHTATAKVLSAAAQQLLSEAPTNEVQ